MTDYNFSKILNFANMKKIILNSAFMVFKKKNYSLFLSLKNDRVKNEHLFSEIKLLGI